MLKFLLHRLSFFKRKSRDTLRLLHPSFLGVARGIKVVDEGSCYEVDDTETRVIVRVEEIKNGKRD